MVGVVCLSYAVDVRFGVDVMFCCCLGVWCLSVVFVVVRCPLLSLCAAVVWCCCLVYGVVVWCGLVCVVCCFVLFVVCAWCSLVV